jgi:hypothetical protein
MRQNQNIKPSQVIVARSVTTNDSASFVFDTRGYSSASVSAQVLDLIPVRGSSRASTWISEAISNTGFVDVVLIGDSNTGFTQYGICNGLVHAMCTLGASQYATPLYEMWRGSDGSEHGCPSSDGVDREGMKSFGTAANYTSSDRALATSAGGTGNAPSRTQANFTLGSSEVQGFGVAESNALWVPAASTFSDFNLGMQSQNISSAVGESLHKTDALKYRFYYATEATGGSVKIRIYPTGVGSETFDTVSLANTAGELGWKENTTAINAASGRTSLTLHVAGGGVGPSNAITGPGAFFWQTMYRPSQTHGFAVQPFEYYGGRTLTQMATDVSRASGGWLRQYMKAIAQRQTSAGGGSRTVFWIQGGTNLDANAIAARDSVQTIINSVRTAWSAAGYAASDLAFVAHITHQVEDPDALADRRVRLRELTQSNSDLTVIEPQMLESFDEAQSTVSALSHQTISGYHRQCLRWIEALQAHGASAQAPASIVLEHGDTTASFSSISGFTSGTDFSIGSTGSTSRPTVVCNVDMRGRKRYLRLSVKPSQLSDIAAFCVLSDPSDAPISAGDLDTSNRVIK